MSETFYKPLTPQFRAELNKSIYKNMEELKTCQNNVYVSMQRAANNAARKIINALPDGYPMPMERTYRDQYMDRIERRY